MGTTFSTGVTKLVEDFIAEQEAFAELEDLKERIYDERTLVWFELYEFHMDNDDTIYDISGEDDIDRAMDLLTRQIGN